MQFQIIEIDITFEKQNGLAGKSIIPQQKNYLISTYFSTI